MRPLDDATLGRCVPWTTHALVDASLTDVSRSFGTGWPYPGIGYVGLWRRSRAYITLKYYVEPVYVRLVVIWLVMASTFMRSRIGPHRSGTRRSRDASSKRRVVQGILSPRDKNFRSGIHWSETLYHIIFGSTYTQQGKSLLCIPRKGIARPLSQFSHSCVCGRFIYSWDRSIYFPVAD
jgi:hypothetical protein